MDREQSGSWSARAATRQDFAPLAPADLAHIRSAAKEATIEAGTRLLAAGDPADGVGDIPLFLEAPMPFDAVVSRRALDRLAPRRRPQAVARHHDQ